MISTWVHSHLSQLPDFITSHDPNAAAQSLARYSEALPEQAKQNASSIEVVERWIQAARDGQPSPLVVAEAQAAALSMTTDEDYD